MISVWSCLFSDYWSSAFLINFIIFSLVKDHCNFWAISLQALDSVTSSVIWSWVLAIDILFRSHFGSVSGKECNLLDVVEGVLNFHQTKKRQVHVLWFCTKYAQDYGFKSSSRHVRQIFFPSYFFMPMIWK